MRNLAKRLLNPRIFKAKCDWRAYCRCFCPGSFGCKLKTVKTGMDYGSEKLSWCGRVERLGWGGVGLSRALDNKLVVLHAPLAVFPGEEVEAMVAEKPKHYEGDITRVLSPDPRRVEPRCPVAEECGGCALWGAGMLAGDLKQLMVEDLLARNLPEAPHFDWLPAPEGTKRCRIQVHWDGKKLGFFAWKSRDIVEIPGCPMAASVVSDAITHLERALKAGVLPLDEGRWALSTGTPPDKVMAAKDGTGAVYELSGESWGISLFPYLEHTLDDISIRQSPKSFFQVCPEWAWKAFSGVFENWETRGSTLFDLHGGVGLFSLLLRHSFSRFVLVETSDHAADDAFKNLSILADYKIHVKRVENWL